MAELQPLVSIITVTRNRAYLISRAIESILKQTYTNFEYIIIDGASEDNTKEVVHLFNDSRIKFVEMPLNDILLATKLGFELSTGDFITFLDDDDEYLPLKIEKQLNLIQSLPETYGFVYCWMDYYDDSCNKFLYTHKAELRGNVATEVVEDSVVSGTPSYFFRRNAFEFLGGWREIGLISDWELAARACQYYFVDYVPESLVKVHINHGSLRMSDKDYNKGRLKKFIKFHTHFLTEYKTIFDQFPQKKSKHLYIISGSYFMLGEWRNGWPYYKNLLNETLTLKNLLLPPYCIIKREKQL